MPDLTILITQSPNLSLPASLIGWIGWFIFLTAIILLNIYWKSLNQQGDIRTLILILISIPITTLLLPSVIVDIRQGDLVLPLLGAIPWFLAAGYFGPGLAAGAAFASGLLISLWGGYSTFFPLESALLATCLGWMYYQGYRTPFFKTIRHPIVAAILFSVVYPLIFLISTLLEDRGSIGTRLTFGLENLLSISVTLGVMFLLAGIISEILAYYMKPKWGFQGPLKPSPAERKLATRFLISVVPLSIFLLLVLIVGAWTLAGRSAREMLEGRMSIAAEITVQGIPFYLETGQNLLLRLADEMLYDLDSEEVRQQLALQRREIPYFSQLIFLDPDGGLISSDPPDALITNPLSSDEHMRILAAPVVPFDVAAVPTGGETNSALLSFIAGVSDQAGELRGILIGRSDLAVNPFAKPLISGLQSTSIFGGDGMLIDEKGVIIYHQDPGKVMSVYDGYRGDSPQFFDLSSPDGNRELVYYHPVEGKPWSVVFRLPHRFIQDQAVNMALPLIGMIAILVIFAIAILRYALRPVTKSLEELAIQADRIASGDLDHPVEIRGEDEVGKLRIAFEQMRKSLKTRLDEADQLLFVSKGISTTIDLEESLSRVIESTLEIGASSARIYLLPTIIPKTSNEKDKPLRFGYGPAASRYSYLDEQVSGLAERQHILKLNNLTRPKLFSNPDGKVPPQAILAVALQNENQYFGALWAAFDHPHKFTEGEVRFISTLASQAVISIENIRFYLTSEIERQRLTSILDATPDAVILTDQDDNLLLINNAAMEVLNLFDDSWNGYAVTEAIKNEALLSLLEDEQDGARSREIKFEDGKVFYASVSEVEVEGIGAGRVCLLRDVTSLKQLDSSKSDFVSTVSHDLRSPLALIQGYTSMLHMVGDLNEQQSSYLNKISDETDKMSHLVTNLLDLGRIEAEVGLQLEKRPVDDVVERVVDAAKVQADQKRIKLIADISQSQLPLIEADQALLQQALYNLVDNAIKYTDPGGDVRLQLKVQKGTVVYIVVDNGIGISPADQQYLFEKFFKSSGKQGLETGGSGLGLAIASSIAEKHHGKISVESKLGSGSTFFLELPLTQTKN